METIISTSKAELGAKAAIKGAGLIREAIQINGAANIIVATGASQFEMLNELIKQDVDWSRVSAFHLDEYIGISVKHPASFRRYLEERISKKVSLREFYFVNGEADPLSECARLGEIINNYPIDVAFIGIGENGHLAFNDPPADFDTEEPFIVVTLDEQCRRQQWGEGWFPTIEDVPERAISMSIRQIMKSKSIICSVPDRRKAEAVRDSFRGDVSPLVPASVLQQHKSVFIYLDNDSASLLS